MAIALAKSSSTLERRKKASGEKPNLSPASPACQVTESPELTRVVRQFIEANRAPWQAEKDF
jgi:hypothetical protein